MVLKSYLYNFLSFIRCLTLYRVYNFLLINISYILSVITKRYFLWGKPWSISVEPTTFCNLKCVECPSGQNSLKRQNGSISLELYEKILKQIESHTFYLNMYFQGEPFLHHDFLKMVKIAKEKNIYVSTSTNGHFLTDKIAKETVLSGLNRLIVSLDGINQQTYEQYRKGGNFNRVIQGINSLVSVKKQLNKRNPYIILQFIVFSTNENQVDEVKKLGKKLGVDEVQIKTAQINDNQNINSLLPIEERFSRYKKNSENKLVLKHKLKNKCYKIWHSLVITWDGIVVPCCYDKYAEFDMGNLNTDNIVDIWRCDKFKSFRKNILKQRSSINICCNCDE